MIPNEVADAVEKLTGKRPDAYAPLGGGSINQVFRLGSGGMDIVVKYNSARLSGMFEAEAKGLSLLREHSGDIIVPEVLASGKGSAHSWLIITHVDEGVPDRNVHARFGEALARMHRNTSPLYGLDHDNYIGSLPQSNQQEKTWKVFFHKRRILPQLKMAVESGKLSAGLLDNAERMFLKMDDLFPDEPASLLHGDLWGGNVIYSTNGKTAIIDPAVHYGHREAELAFTRMFGGFSPVFYDAYRAEWPLAPGFESRVPMYNLYPLLVHVNLFGGGYISSATAILKKF